MIDILTDKQIKVLQALATYKFLTISQFKQLCIDKHDSNLRTALKPLLERKRKLIDRIMFSIYPKSSDLSKRTRLEYMYYLKPMGKRVLLENQIITATDTIRMPIGNGSMAYRDYDHRKSTINCHIALNQSAAGNSMEVLFFDTYFDKIGNNRRDGNLRAKTRIDVDAQQYLIPDAVFKLKSPQQEHLYCYEMQNGKDTKYIIKKLDDYAEALAKGSPNIRYQYQRGVRVLIVCEHDSLLEAAINRMNTEAKFQHFQKHFLFKPLAEIDDFLHGWTLLTGERARMY